MKKLFLSLSLLFGLAIYAQDYRTHKVQAGETIEEIARQYLVTPFDIYALNPDAKSALDPEMVLIIPKSRLAENPTQTESREIQGFTVHKVRRKETLYSISKKYEITVEDIKQHNKRLYSENLRKGDRIQIPKYRIVMLTNNLENTLQKYTVLPKEGKWRIAYRYGLTVEELEKINPGLGETLQVGQQINVPNLADNEIKSVDEDYGYYTVLPKEGYYRLKLKLSLEQEQLEALNPELIDGGLKAGMILKVPKDTDVANPIEAIASTSLINKIKNYETKRLAVMLPFRLHRIDLDSIREARDILENDGYMSVAVDFHSGVLMALDSAKQFGISTILDVYDTQARVSKVSSILSDNDFSKYDAVIGPFTASGFDRAADILRRDDVPIISAVIKPSELYRNVFQTIPSDAFLRKTMMSYLESLVDDYNLVVISDEKNRGINNEFKREFASAKQVFSRKNKEGKDSYYVIREDIENQLEEGKNIVFLETSNEGFISNVTSILNALNGETVYEEEERTVEREIILMTSNKNKAFDGANISNIDLSALKFHYPSVNCDYDSSIPNNFVNAYKRLYNGEPNKYVVRGFDLTMDLLLRLASAGDLYEAASDDISTEYVENKFRYNKKMFGGYYNEAAYIIKFEDLKLVKVTE